MGKFKKSVSLLTYGLNEEEALPSFLDYAFDLLSSTVEDFEIIFVDDGSYDRTPTILKEYASRDHRLKIVTHPHNMNVGFALRSAINNATKDYIFWQTVDCSYELKYLSIFLKLLESYDVVQGVRPIPIRLFTYIPLLKSIHRVKTRSDNFWKAIVSLINYYTIRILFAAPFSDFQNVTFYKTEFLHSLPLSGTSSFVNPECLLRAYYKGARVIEVPISFTKRTKGLSKGTKLSSIFKSCYDIISSWLNWGLMKRLQNNPIGKIYKVSTPFDLNEETIKICAPLFKEFL
jgi:glycosyltransferase involved in cell wall biosynthesis